MNIFFCLSPSLPTSVAFIAYLSPFRCKFAACRTRGRRSSRVTAPGRCPPSTAGAEGDHTRPDGAPIRTRRYINYACPRPVQKADWKRGFPFRRSTTTGATSRRPISGVGRRAPASTAAPTGRPNTSSEEKDLKPLANLPHLKCH